MTPLPPLRACRQTSPNFGPRSADVSLDFILLHYTGMESTQAALARLCTKGTEVSAHYLIDDDGVLYQLVDEDKRAWHAGKGFWRGVRDINSAAIGIELSNPGHAFGYRPFTDAQIKTLLALLPDILARHKTLRADQIWGHADIAPARKEDPGELFPWDLLAAKGFGLWPDLGLLEKEKAKPALSPCEARDLLRRIGYEATESESALRADIIAFQRHFRQRDIKGNLDEETSALLRALVAKI